MASASPRSLMADQSRILPSSPAERMLTPLGLNVAERTAFSCLISDEICLPVRAFQTRTAPSWHPVTTHSPFGLNSAEETTPAWRKEILSPEDSVQTRAV